MGHAVATAALRRGAEVVLISGPTALKPPEGAVYVPVQTAEEMREAAHQHLGAATVVIKAAAVADYRVERPSATKIKSGGKRDGWSLELVPNPDILKELARRRAAPSSWASPPRPTTCARRRQPAPGHRPPVASDVSQQGTAEADDGQVILLDRWGAAMTCRA
jgi:hypothetical protein